MKAAWTYFRPHVLATLFAPILLAGCANEYSDYRHTNPIVVRKELATMVLDAGSKLNAMDSSRLERFVTEYDYRGEGPLELAVRVDARGEDAARARALAVGEMAIARGLRADRLRVRLAPPLKAESKKDAAQDEKPAAEDAAKAADLVMLSYVGYVAAAPECGDWTKDETFTPYNGSTPNYGCAVQRNIGLMAADPRDLLRARDSDIATGDGERTGQVVGAWRKGDATPSKGAVSAKTSK